MGTECCGVAVTVTRKESDEGQHEPRSLQTAGADPEARADAAANLEIFGDNKSRLPFLQTAEFTAIFDPH
jgi:hypothetical protein